ncbi:Hypothetical predicted protein [Pelobates cultripes]|uniref:Uncharacterized protein n=1 Tax=Pelobates cultripes TaxID=61616 RepID=A0AAD1WAV9_PELCU|nr:Hypothetical predicted protein [Pelobates cultripes]
MADSPPCHSKATTYTQCRPVSQGGLEAKLDAILEAFWAKLAAKAASPQRDPPAKDQRQAAQKGCGSRSGIQRCPVPATSGNCLLGPGATKSKHATHNYKPPPRAIIADEGEAPTVAIKQTTRYSNMQTDTEEGAENDQNGSPCDHSASLAPTCAQGPEGLPSKLPALPDVRSRLNMD